MNKKIFAALLFTAATGIATGVFFEINMTGDGKNQLMNLLAGFFAETGAEIPLQQNFLATFWQSFRNGFLCLLLCSLPLVTPLLAPVPVLIIFSRGFFLGFSAAMVLETFGLAGIRHLALTLVPPGMIQLLLFSVLAAVSLSRCRISLQKFLPRRNGSRSSSAKKRTALQFPAEQYQYLYLAGLGLLILCCLLQAVLLQAEISPSGWR